MIDNTLTYDFRKSFLRWTELETIVIILDTKAVSRDGGSQGQLTPGVQEEGVEMKLGQVDVWQDWNPPTLANWEQVLQ